MAVEESAAPQTLSPLSGSFAAASLAWGQVFKPLGDFGRGATAAAHPTTCNLDSCSACGLEAGEETFAFGRSHPCALNLVEGLSVAAGAQRFRGQAGDRGRHGGDFVVLALAVAGRDPSRQGDFALLAPALCGRTIILGACAVEAGDATASIFPVAANVAWVLALTSDPRVSDNTGSESDNTEVPDFGI